MVKKFFQSLLQRVEFFDAKQAKITTDKIKEKKIQDTLREIYRNIHGAVHEGKYEIRLDFEPDEEVIKTLESKGFKIELIEKEIKVGINFLGNEPKFIMQTYTIIKWGDSDNAETSSLQA